MEEPKKDFNAILRELRRSFQFHECKLDKDDFFQFVPECGYPNTYKEYFGGYYLEKLLEHYLSIKLLNITSEDILIDIAADQSYFAEYVQKKWGIESYKQDLICPKGITSSPSVPLVGGDAACLPFKDKYFSVITLHCSIEHFEGDSDIRFIKEAHRVLKPGGRICILPLYVGEEYYAVTDPAFCNDLVFDGPIYEKPGFGNRQCRVYSVEALKTRLGKPEIFYFPNAADLVPDSYCQLAAVFRSHKTYWQRMIQWWRN